MDTSQRVSLTVCCLLLWGLAGVSGRVSPRVSRLGHHTPSLDHTRIVGGYVTSQGQFPSMLALYHHTVLGKTLIGGGVLINDNHVLTTAHLFYMYEGEASSFEVVAGEQNLDEDSGFEQAQTGSLIVVHENFTSNTGANDIAILKTSGHFALEDGIVEVVPMPADHQTPSGTCTAVGWGYTEYGGSISPELRAVDLPYITDEECRDIFFANEISDDMICAGVFGGAGVCNADNGGPLFCDGVVMGLVSQGFACDSYPGIFTEVSHYLDWIKFHSED